MSQTTLDIKEPGLNVLPPGVERHVVNAGGLTGLQIYPCLLYTSDAADE